MIQIDGDSLTLESFFDIVDNFAEVSLSASARAKIVKSRAAVEKAAASGERHYSINTGFGILSKVSIPSDQLETLQVNLIRSHCAGVGDAHSERESRAILLLRTNVMAKGYCGVRPELVDLCLGMLNKKVHPRIPTKGSVGASGDLAPLAHLAAVLIGEGDAIYQGFRLTGKEALEKAGLKPIKLAAKEGLSLINGTQQMTAMAALLLRKAERLVDTADLICSASLEGILGSPKAYKEWVHALRPHEGQVRSAKLLRTFMEDSEIYQSHLTCDRVQDPYSLRCAPQVHGACRDLLSQVRRTVEVELNAATDNPLVNPDTGEIVSNGNFHGQPLAFALDILGMAVAELGNISERRTVKLINPVFSELPTFLVKNEGLNSGMMIAQYTAASLVVENRGLTHPASCDSVTTNNEKEDHNSMGPIAARQAQQILANAHYILAVEALCACQALEFRKPLKPGKGPRALYAYIREEIPALDTDRYLHKDMERVAVMIREEELWQDAKSKGLL